MTRMITALTVCALFTGGAAAAQTPPPTQQTPPATPPQQTPAPAPAPVPFPADAKIAFINLQAVVSQSSLGKAGSKEMQTLTAARNEQIQAKQKEIQALQAKAQAQATVMSADALNSMNRDLDRMNRELQFMQQQAQADIQAKNQELLDNFQVKVLPIVEELRKEKGLWVIFAVQDQADAPGGLAVAAAHEGLDLTMEVVKRLDAISK
ncbi:MAG: OmpH family outer membrane protein [Vicinamibacterales bacterium]